VSLQHSGTVILFIALLLFFYLPLILPPILGLAGIHMRKRDFLSVSAAISIVVAVSLLLLSRNPFYLASPVLLIFSAFTYQGGIIRATRKENLDSKLKKIAFVLAGISLLAAIITTLYIERVLIVDSCYSFQTTTGRVRICEDFRPGYVLPVILSVIGAAGILRNNKIMINTSAALSFVRLVTSLSAIDTLFVPSFTGLIISAFVYQKGIMKGDIHIHMPVETRENRMQYQILLLLFAVLIIWIFSVYLFIHPNISGGSGSYFPPDHP
jgi:phage-related holin